MKKKLSIIIPAHNSNDKLALSLHRLSHLEEIEIVVVDDCGTEYCSALSADFPGIVFHRLDFNQGAGAARNIGIELATSPYVTFMDADDIIYEEGILKALLLLEEGGDILFFPPTSHDSDGSFAKRHLKYEKLVLDFINDESYDALLYKFHVPWSKIYSLNFLLKNGIRFDTVSASNDVLFSLKSASNAKQVRAYNECFYSVLEHKNGLTGIDTTTRLLDRLHVAKSFNDEVKILGKFEYRVSLLPLYFRLLKLSPKISFCYLKNSNTSLFDWIPSILSIKTYMGFR